MKRGNNYEKGSLSDETIRKVESFKSYKELLALIDINESILETCRHNLSEINKYVIRNNAPTNYPEGTSYLDADTIHGGKKEMHLEDWQKLIEEGGRIQSMILLQESILKGLKETKDKIDKKLAGLQGIECKIIYFKYCEGLNLSEIASKLGYSYDYIREVHARITHNQPTDKAI